MDALTKQLLAMDSNIPAETVPDMLAALEKLQKDVRVVDNHLLILAGTMQERKRLAMKEVRRKRRAAAYKWTFGLAKRVAQSIGHSVVSAATFPVRTVRARFTKAIEAPKSKKRRARRSKKSVEQPTPAVASE